MAIQIETDRATNQAGLIPADVYVYSTVMIDAYALFSLEIQKTGCSFLKMIDAYVGGNKQDVSV